MGFLETWSRRISNLFSGVTAARRRKDKDKSRRGAWDKSASWFRLRYEDQEKATDFLRRANSSADRVALRFAQNGSALHCWIGVPTRYQEVIGKMAPTFGCSVEPVPYAELPAPLEIPFEKVSGVPESILRADAYLVSGGYGYAATQTSDDNIASINIEKMATPNNDKRAIVFFPSKSDEGDEGDTSPHFLMPEPVLGINNRAIPAIPTDIKLLRQPSDWLLGYDQNGRVLGAPQVGVVGSQKGIESWVLTFAKATLQEHPTNLVIIDGSGDLYDDLMRHAYIKAMRNSGEMFTYDTRMSNAGGFNPLLPSASGSPTDTLERWIWFFTMMGIEPNMATQAITAAFNGGVRPSLKAVFHWLMDHAAQIPEASVAIRSQITRLNNDDDIGRWFLDDYLQTDPRVLASRGSVLVTTRGATSWARQIAIYAMIALLAETNTAMIIHDVPLPKNVRSLLINTRIAVTRSKLPATVIVRCDNDMADQFAWGDVHPEHLMLIPPQTSLIRSRSGGAVSSWKIKT